MKLSLLALSATLSTLVVADSVAHPYVAPTSSDRRSPCPMLNSMANHGFLARSGVNISMSDLISAFDAAINMAADAAELVGAVALTASTTGNASTFHLDDVDKHGIIEHDGSLSRADIYFGDNHSFNASIWNGTKAYFTDEIITISTAATARAARLALDATQNPTMNITTSQYTSSLIESSLYLTVFGNPVDGNASRSYVEAFFEEERLPYHLGWVRPTFGSNVTTLETLAGKIAAVSV
ncbi:hypothetical protein BP5796_07930 [Coleophoma crateriformis]|uniref:Heme haloperoxidase family profile domain-containing protein n=1 Tax=Coleophoma crateriformis TaxID=565419 RepID=A0A3D8RD72_9HELO|nr:hypothetical protein BP5796_07930 [Coleophoma crateriformis]